MCQLLQQLYKVHIKIMISSNAMVLLCSHTPPLELTRGWPKRQFLHVTVIFKQQFTLFITFSLFFFRSRTSPTSWPGRGGKGQIMVQKKECLCVFHQVLATMCDEELNYCCSKFWGELGNCSFQSFFQWHLAISARFVYAIYKLHRGTMVENF